MTSWSCPHYTGEICRLIRTECKPASPGCVLEGRVVTADHTPTPAEVERAKRRVAKRSKKGAD
ncbi:MAG: hypothetical protein IT198_11360 [Acidimicrobiia bacterium]|nr:hypothetical protein [Acidimicrobiia bacterium]